MDEADDTGPRNRMLYQPQRLSKFLEISEILKSMYGLVPESERFFFKRAAGEKFSVFHVSKRIFALDLGTFGRKYQNFLKIFLKST